MSHTNANPGTNSVIVESRFPAHGLKGADDWRIEGYNVFKNGKLFVDLNNVQSGVWDQLQGKGNLTSTLDFRTSGKKVRLLCGGRGMSANQREFHRFSALILLRLDESRSDARIHMGGGLSSLIIKFVFAFIAVVAGLVLVMDFSGLTALTAPPENDPVMVLVGVALLLFGLGWGWFNRPWDSDRMAVAPADAAAILASRL